MIGKLFSSFSDTKPRDNPKLLIYPEKSYDGRIISYPPISKRLAAAAGDCVAMIIFLTPIFFIINYFLYPNGIEAEFSAIHKYYYNDSKDAAESLKQMLSDSRYQSLALKQIIAQSLSCIIIAGFLLFFNIKYNSSPAKMAFKCYILDAQTYEPPTKKQFFIRNLAYIFTIGTLFLGLIISLLNPRRRMLHDIIAKTVVVKLTKN